MSDDPEPAFPAQPQTKKEGEEKMKMKKLLSAILAAVMAISCVTPAFANVEIGTQYDLQVTDADRAAIHAAVDALSGYEGKDMVSGDGTYDPLTLVGTMLDGSSYDSISHGSRAEGTFTPTEYPFPVTNAVGNRNEYDRKSAKLAWIVDVAEKLGFPVVVQRQPDKTIYMEIGDPEAPEMVMALSHLDSPTASISAAQLARWRNAEGELGAEGAYHSPYIKDGWVYGAGIQDDSGPTLATMYAALAMMKAGVPMDRRVRIVMGIYEDGGPGTPSVANTLKYMDIPYYTSNPSFYDNWAYKSLNREETPIAAYTSDSRFPVVVGNSKSSTPNMQLDLSADAGKPFSMTSALAGVTLREGDPTLKDIAYGSTTQVASRSIITLNVAGVAEADRVKFENAILAAATEQGWLPAAEGTTPKVQVTFEAENELLVLEVNTDVAMEMPMPHYGKNAIVWSMYLLSEAFEAQGIKDMALNTYANGIVDLFFQDCVEGEAYIGAYFLPEDLLRHPDSGVPNMTFGVMANINNEVPRSYFDAETNLISIPLYIRSMFAYKPDYDLAVTCLKEAFVEAGINLNGTIAAFSNPTLYLANENPLIALQFESYKASMEFNPDEFADVYGLLDISSPVGTTGGTLATNFRNKMTAFGAVIPGNERWWHTANERMKVESAIQMTKMMADGMLEMARYSGPAGAQFMWADIEGLNANRAELDLLDATIATYVDASEVVTEEHLGDNVLMAATSFDIPMWKDRGNTSFTQAQYDLGHEAGGCYLPLDNEDFLANTFVLPMRLEFKVERPSDMSAKDWATLVSGGYENFTFGIVVNGEAVELVVPEGADADKYFASRVSMYDDDVLYISANLAITDAAYEGVTAITADSKTDLFDLNDTWLETNENPFPERGQIEERGFFLLGDGEKNARFGSPDAIYVAAEPVNVTVSAAKGGSVSASASGTVAVGTKVELTADANYGYAFKNWTVNGQVVSTKASTTFTVVENAEIVANFTLTAVNGSARPVEIEDPTPVTPVTPVTPATKLTRAMLVQMLYELEGKPAVSGTANFSDVAASANYAAAVKWASDNGVVAGMGDGTFAPNANVTREQLAVILMGYAKSEGKNVSATTDLAVYADAANVSSWAEAAMKWAVASGVMTGKTATTLDPKGTATNAEVAKMLESI